MLCGEASGIRDYAFSETQSWEMLRNERWKYVRYLDIRRTDREVLIDLKADPLEKYNLAAALNPPQILDELRQHLAELTDATPRAQLNHLPVCWPMPSQ